MKLLEASQAARRTHRVFPATRIHFGDCHERNVMKHPLLDLQFELALSVTVVEKKEKKEEKESEYTTKFNSNGVSDSLDTFQGELKHNKNKETYGACVRVYIALHLYGSCRQYW